MDGFRAKYVLILILLVQTHAHPLLSGKPMYQDSRHYTGANERSETFEHREIPPIVDGISTCQSSVSYESGLPTNVVFEIVDGQVQVHGSSHSNTNVGTIEDVTTCAPEALELPAQGDLMSISEVNTSPSSGTRHARSVASSTAATGSFITSVPESALSYLTTSAVQTATASGPRSTGGTIISSVEQTLSALPFLMTASYATSSLSLIDLTALLEIQPTAVSIVSTLSVSNIFQSVAADPPPPQVSQRLDHPVPRLNIVPQERKLQTNKFYSNFYLGNQSNAVFTFPYSITWICGNLINADNHSSQSWGMAVSHIDRDVVVHAEPKFDPVSGLRLDGGDWASYSNPLGIKSIVLSASELVNTHDGYPELGTSALEWGSVSADLYAHGWQTPTVQFPVVQGASFITAKYNRATPVIQSGIGFKTFTYLGATGSGSTFKYTAQLMGDVTVTWLIYITPDPFLSPDYPVNYFTYDGATDVQGASNFTGLVQVAKVPIDALSTTSVHSLYDQAAGVYASDVEIFGSTDTSMGSYTLSWQKRGNPNQPLLMFALPHHLSSFDTRTAAAIKNDLILMTPTKGMGTAVQGDSWTLVEENLPVDMNFAPYSPATGLIDQLSNQEKHAIRTAGAAEIAQDIELQVNTNTTYFDGKALAKFAGIIYVLHEIVGEKRLAVSGLLKLQAQFEEHIRGQQKYPLIYESAWGGVVSIASYEMENTPGGEYYDFGNTYYNDHHFHYGYFVYTAAVIGYLDPDWLDQGTNKAWVNMLVRDYANPVDDDPYFPFSRCFDWYHGHSWAAGLFEGPDGKNQESSSEDSMASYALKMWGQVIGDSNMMARGNLMLAVQARSFQDYYLLDSQNQVQPPEFIGNHVSGILFENKIDHTTYFGSVPEYVQGIHMIPIMPFSTYIRTPTFVQQEWDTYFANYSDGVQPYINRVQSGWRGLLMANYAIVDASTSFDFFDDTDFDQIYLDNGASQTWYLAWAAALKRAGHGYVGKK